MCRYAVRRGRVPSTCNTILARELLQKQEKKRKIEGDFCWWGRDRRRAGRARPQCVKKTSTLLYRECRGDHWSPASLAQQRAFRDGFLTRHTGTGEQCSPPQEFFDSLGPGMPGPYRKAKKRGYKSCRGASGTPPPAEWRQESSRREALDTDHAVKMPYSSNFFLYVSASIWPLASMRSVQSWRVSTVREMRSSS